jgi:hypothetical protein
MRRCSRSLGGLAPHAAGGGDHNLAWLPRRVVKHAQGYGRSTFGFVLAVRARDQAVAAVQVHSDSA